MPNREARWTLLEADATTEIQQVEGEDEEIAVQLSPAGGNEVYLTLRRSNVQHKLFTAKWLAPLSALYLEEPLMLFCEDETGPDWMGSDEITLKLYLDGEASAFFETTWSADSDEFLGLLDAVKNAIRLPLDGAGNLHSERISYSSDRIRQKAEASADERSIG
jgi:hypothetical protein